MHSLSRGTPQSASGFTLLELMVTVALAAILGAVALPYLGGFIDRSRARGAASELEAALYYARAEAIARSSDVSVCAREAVDAKECADHKDGKAWQNGWLVKDVAANFVLRASSSAPPPEIEISADKRGSFVFTRTGLTGLDAAKQLTTGTIDITRPKGGQPVFEACLVINNAGRIRRVAGGSTKCT